MGVATLDGIPFRIDPRSINWDYSIQANDVKTVGGKVVQIVGATLGDMTVEGSFGKGGWQEQSRFLARMKVIADKQIQNLSVRNSTSQPLRFLYPPRKWNFLVYLKQYAQGQQGQGQKSVTLANTIVAPSWQLTLFIVEDNAGLRTVAKDLYIERLSAGLGWRKTAYNGPMGVEDLDSVLNGLTVQEYLTDQYGTNTPGGSSEKD